MWTTHRKTVGWMFNFRRFMVIMTHEDVVSIEIAEELKSLGFYWDTHKFYVIKNYCEGNNPYFFDTYGYGELVSSPKYKQYEDGDVDYDDEYNIPAPTLGQVRKWLIEKYNVVIIVDIPDWEKYEYAWIVFNTETKAVRKTREKYRDYFDALKDGISNAFYFIKKEQWKQKT